MNAILLSRTKLNWRPLASCQNLWPLGRANSCWRLSPLRASAWSEHEHDILSITIVDHDCCNKYGNSLSVDYSVPSDTSSRH